MFQRLEINRLLPSLALTLCMLTSLNAEQANKTHSPDLPALMQESDKLAQMLDDQTARHRLIAIDYELSEHQNPEISQLREKVLRLLAKSEDEDAIQYIRTVFETDTEHRDEAAYALSEYAIQKPSSLPIWRFLIRSLTVVEGEQAVSVLKALSRYRQRATNSRWIRRVILIGLRLPEADKPAALQLLRHWTGVRVSRFQNNSDAPVSSSDSLKFYQNWFRKKWPDELDPSWPNLPENSRWSYEVLNRKLAPLQFNKENVNRGKLVYSKANCAKCHPKGERGEKFGPDLSDISGLRQRKELLEAILFPNLELNEDYPSITLLTTSGKTYSGLMSAGKQGTVSVVGSEGKAVSIHKNEIESISPSRQSNMPAGALEPLTFQEICDLIAFLEHRANPKRPYHKQGKP